MRIRKCDVDEAGRRIAERERKEADENRNLLSGRAGKLLKKEKPFIVIACDEPYFLAAYRMVRLHERHTGRWTDEDEVAFLKAMEDWSNDLRWTKWRQM